jgi:ABC-type branched-subunit amino acid transport system substrate-binding protein
MAEGAVAVTYGLNKALAAGARIVGSSGLCTSAWSNPARRVVPAENLYCMAPGPGLATAAGQVFAHAYKRAFGVVPDPAAAYGYEAMELGLGAIKDLGSHANSRIEMLEALANSRDPDSLIGPISFTATGDIESKDYSVYSVGRSGSLNLYKPPSTPAGG